MIRLLNLILRDFFMTFEKTLYSILNSEIEVENDSICLKSSIYLYRIISVITKSG